MTEIIISEEDYKELIDLYTRAQNAPVITMSVDSPSFADQAWDRVRDLQQSLGEKYKYDWKTHAVNADRKVIKV